LKPEELIDWVNNMDKYFKWSSLIEDKNGKLASKIFKGHALI